MSFFAKNIQVLRLRKKLTQADMKLQLGYNRTTWNNYERGVSQPDLEGFFKIANFFDIPVEDLFLLEIKLTPAYPETENEKAVEKKRVNEPVKAKGKNYEDLETHSVAADEGPGKERPKTFVPWPDPTSEIKTLKNLVAKHNSRLSLLEQKVKEIAKIARKIK